MGTNGRALVQQVLKAVPNPEASVIKDVSIHDYMKNAVVV